MEKLQKSRFRFYNNQLIIQAMALSGVIWYIIFHYLPMYGLIIAFKEYSFRKGMFASPFVGFKYFIELFTDPEIPGVVLNTLAINGLKLLICFPVPILFAVLLNEISSNWFKRLVQTVSYFPHFISWVIIAMIITYWFSSDYGLVNNVLVGSGILQRPITPLTDSGAFYWIAIFSDMWKNTGWSAIIFMAAIAGVDQSVYEAATVDGASKIQKIIYITIPSIVGTIVLMFLMKFANIFTGGGGTFEQSMFLGNPFNYDKSIVLQMYTMRIGIQLGRFSYATAVGFVNSTVSLILLLLSNNVCKKLFNRSLYVTEEG